MARIHGNRGMVKMDPAGGSTTTEVASLNEWKLDLGRDRVDVTCFGDLNKQSVVGLASYAGTFKGCWDKDTTPAFFKVVLGTTAAMLELVMDRDDPTFLFKGLAHLDGAVNVSATGAVTIDGKFDAAGPWAMEPSTP
jgi:hypothetical protein